MFSSIALSGRLRVITALANPTFLWVDRMGHGSDSNQRSKLYKVSISNRSVTQLMPTIEPGVVWTGAWNGSQWLISGFGAASSAANASNPFIYLYDGQNQIPRELRILENNKRLGMVETSSQRATMVINGYSPA